MLKCGKCNSEYPYSEMRSDPKQTTSYTYDVLINHELKTFNEHVANCGKEEKYRPKTITQAMTDFFTNMAHLKISKIEEIQLDEASYDLLKFEFPRPSHSGQHNIVFIAPWGMTKITKAEKNDSNTTDSSSSAKSIKR